MANPWVPRWGDPAVRYNTGWKWPTQAEIAAAKMAGKMTTKGKKMKHQNWYPKRMADQILWHENFRSKLGGYTVTLGLTQARVDAAIASSRFVIYVLSQWLPAARAFGPTTTDAVDLLLNGTGGSAVVFPTFTAPALPNGVAPVPPGVVARLFDLVSDIKHADGYTKTIGDDLGIEGGEDATQHAVPEISADVIADSPNESVELSFTKYGHTGVYFESRRGNLGWQFLGVDTDSPYVDSRPLLAAGVPEVREYRARFWDKGEPNGDWTDVVKVTVAP